MYLPKGISSSLFHLLCRAPLIVAPIVVGLLLAMPHLVSGPSCCVPEALLTICFDDGYTSVYANAYPILTKYGYSATVFVIPSLVGQEGYMRWNQLHFLYQKGWEIGSHSLTHPYLTKLPDKQIEKELYLSKKILEEHGFQVFSFASPYGDWDERVIEIAKKYYLLHRTSWPFDLNDLPLSKKDRYYLRAVAVDEISIEQTKEWIKRAKEEHKWLILIFHRVGEKVPRYNVSPQELEEIIRYAFNLGFRGANLRELFQSKQPGG